MTNRQIIIDTETTGLDPKNEKIVEIAGIELIDGEPSGRTFQYYLNPQKTISAEAARVHGLTEDLLKDKPLFADIAPGLLDFVKDAIIIAHNAKFDLSFINQELRSAGHKPLDNEVIDTLELARLKFPGAKNNLDTICQRFDISIEERKLHGALKDCYLLEQVYQKLNQYVVDIPFPPQRTDDNNITLAELFEQTLPFIEMRNRNPHHPIGLPSGFEKLDRSVRGFCPGELIIVAARPEVNKCDFAQGIALNVVKSSPVMLFSLAIPDFDMSMRILSKLSGVSFRKIINGRMDHRELSKISVTAKKIEKLPLTINDNRHFLLEDVIKKARETKSQNPGISLIVIDGLNGADSPETTATLKNLAVELNVPIILTVSLPYVPEGYGPPKIHDLNKVAKYADIILILSCFEESTKLVEIAKNNHGYKNMIFFDYNNETLSFSEKVWK